MQYGFLQFTSPREYSTIPRLNELILEFPLTLPGSQKDMGELFSVEEHFLSHN